MRKSEDKKPRRRRKEVILLQDLAPRKDVAGGSGQIFFGQDVNQPGDRPKKGKPQT
jgi:hypothetical protein